MKWATLTREQLREHPQLSKYGVTVGCCSDNCCAYRRSDDANTNSCPRKGTNGRRVVGTFLQKESEYKDTGVGLGVSEAGDESLHEDTVKALPVILQMPTSVHKVFTHVSKDPNCENCKMADATRARCQNMPGESRRWLATSCSFWSSDYIGSQNVR